MEDQDIIQNVDLEKLIIAVRDRPPIWDPAYGTHYDTDKIKKLWEDVYHAIFPRFDSFTAKKKRDLGAGLQTKWRVLRTDFVQEHKRLLSAKSRKRAEATSTFPYYRLMLFMQPALTRSEYLECHENMRGVKRFLKDNKRNVHMTKTTTNNVANLACTYFEQLISADKLLREGDNTDLVDDPDRYALLALLPFVKQVPQNRKMALLEKIYELINSYTE